ncbi:MAG: pyruvate formate lyase family protein [Chloroflexota bacterium]|nr:pyruvate formate lyase family protein [Chloroflexota bacterium]
MDISTAVKEFTYEERLKALREEKEQFTQEKQEIIGYMDYDDWAQILPPEEYREKVESISGSGEEVVEIRLKGVEIESNHPSGAFFGPRLVGKNFRNLLEAHPTYINPMSSLAGAYMVNFYAYSKLGWNPEFDYSDLKEDQERYQLITGIGAKQHFCQDNAIGLDLGFGGLLDKIRHYRQVNPDSEAFYDGLEHVVLGMQDWIERTAETAWEMAAEEDDPRLKQNLEEMAEMNEKLVTEPPETFREACQWMVWYQMAARMFNGSGSLGRLDVLLTPFYERDKAAGILTDEEAMFHIACLLLRDTSYIELGGPDAEGNDITNEVSYLVLEAAHRLKVPANIAVCVGDNVDEGLLRRSVEIQFEDKMGVPKFLGIDNTAEGFARNGYPLALGRERAYSGCHWSGIPGREYTLMDCVKINFGPVFDVALRDMMDDENVTPSVDTLWEFFERHLRQAVLTIAKGMDFHLEHMHEVFPELVLDLCCHGTIEKGLDATNGGVEYYNMCVDGAALATVADSFAALDEHVGEGKEMSWEELMGYLDSNWAGADGERARVLMKSTRRFGYGGSVGDEHAKRLSRMFTRLVKERPTPKGRNMIPGLFSWASMADMGANLGATPNGRYAGDPISQGANPDPGFRPDGAPTAMAVAIAEIQPGYGNTAPIQLDLDPGLAEDEGGLEKVMALIKGHFDLGGTLLNLNVTDSEKILEANEDPSKYPDLIVRVTGFSAYFASLSPELRKLVVDRIIAEG